MKNTILSLVCAICLPLALFAQQLQQPFYYYKGDKVMLEYNTKHIFVSGTQSSKLQQLDPGISKVIESTSIHKDNTSITLTQPTNFKVTHPTRFSQDLTVSENQLGTDVYFNMIKSLKNENSELIVAPFFSSDMTDKIGLSNYFYVKLNDQHDFSILTGLIEKHDLELIGHNIFMPLWFTISVTPDSKNALEMANMFYETGLFAAAEPDLMTDDAPHGADDHGAEDDLTPNDPFFSTQWFLNNTGQNGGTAGIDINAEDAWNIETGDPGIIVAIVDQGFEMNHPDLNGNTFGTGYDTESNSTPAQVLGSHGTACAGLVAAEGQNFTGVTGVAFDARLMSISNSLGGNPNSRQTRANGINWAVAKGADVISNSWGSGVQYQVIDDAIENALTNGRGGLGCVVVFSAGNDNVNGGQYPGNSNPDILCVGAIDRCGVRSGRIDIVPQSCDPWCATCRAGSSFGTPLDVVAGGTNTSTTDRQGAAGYNTNGAGDFANTSYTNGFGGTSAACPIVAGVAALVLSVNPGLEAEEVNKIIELSAQKTRRDLYTYSNTAGRPYGLWNNQMGYGHVDALQAVLLAKDCPSSIVLSGTVHGNLTFSAGNVLISNQDFTNTADVAYHAGNNMRFNSGFTTGGGEFHASIASCKGGNPKRIGTQEEEAITYVYETKNVMVSSIETGESVDLKCFPNPFQSSTTLEYELEDDGHVLLVVTDVNNRVVELLVDQQQDTGIQSVKFSGNDLPSGIYFAKLKTGNKVSTARLLIAK